MPKWDDAYIFVRSYFVDSNRKCQDMEEKLLLFTVIYSNDAIETNGINICILINMNFWTPSFEIQKKKKKKKNFILLLIKYKMLMKS